MSEPAIAARLAAALAACDVLAGDVATLRGELAALHQAVAALTEPPPFTAALWSARTLRRWSQERLGLEAEMDHSLVSRLESGKREPTREAVDKLADGLGLAGAARDVLYASAGYLPPAWRGEKGASA